MMYLILYDISSDSIRTKIAKRLIAEGYERLQLSVFIGTAPPKQNTKLWKQIQQWLQPETQTKFYVLRISKENFKKMSTIGKIDLDVLYLLGEKNSIFI